MSGRRAYELGCRAADLTVSRLVLTALLQGQEIRRGEHPKPDKPLQYRIEVVWALPSTSQVHRPRSLGDLPAFDLAEQVEVPAASFCFSRGSWMMSPPQT